MKNTLRLHVAAMLAGFTLLTAPVYAQVPNLLNYQGRVAVGTVNFEGSGQFRFALVNAAGTTTFWSNDGTSTAGSQPTAAVALTVTKGLYSVLLGDTSLAGMTSAIPASVWTNPDVRLRVWFNNGTNGSQLLTPDQRLAPSGYLPDGSVSTAALASGAVTSAKIASGAVGSAQIASGAVGATQLGANATSINNPNTLVTRDGSGGFAAGNITALGILNIPTSFNANTGVITQNSTRLLHTFGTQNVFVGSEAGNWPSAVGRSAASLSAMEA
jgi:hypothetical protein